MVALQFETGFCMEFIWSAKYDTTLHDLWHDVYSGTHHGIMTSTDCALWPPVVLLWKRKVAAMSGSSHLLAEGMGLLLAVTVFNLSLVTVMT